MLRSIVLISLVAVVGLCSSIRAAAPATQPDLAAENAKLKSLNQELSNQVTQLSLEKQQLESQVNLLRASIIRLKAQLSAMTLQLNTATIKPSPFTLNAIPTPPQPDGGSFKFNGQTVYVTPITGGTFTSVSGYGETVGTPAIINVTPKSATQNLIDDRAKQK